MRSKTKMICLIAALALVPTLTFAKPKPKEEPPRRTYKSVDTSQKVFSDMFIANVDYMKTSFVPNESSKVFSTYLFLSDLGIANSISNDDLAKISHLFFTELPEKGSYKEIIIPSLSKYIPKTDEKQPIDKDGYFFISPDPKSPNNNRYIIETNIPIGSIMAKDYDGYLISLDSPFFKDKVPARWVSIMSLSIKDDFIIYQGISYPSKISPLFYTGTGIGPDKRLANITKPETNLVTIMNDLEDTIAEATKTESTNADEIASINLLKKYSSASLSAYAFLNAEKDKAIEYLNKSKSITIDPPNDIRSANCVRLEEFMTLVTSK